MLNPAVKDGEPHVGLSCLGMDSIDNLGARIKILRTAKGLTQAELGKLVGVTKGAVSQWEGGLISNIKLKTALQLCQVLGTDIHFLVHGAMRKSMYGNS